MKGHNWQKASSYPLGKIINQLSNEELLQFNLACKMWISGAREGKNPLNAGRNYTTIAHKKLKSISKDTQKYEDMGKAILSNLGKLNQTHELITRKLDGIENLDLSHMGGKELLYIFEALPGNLKNVESLDLTHVQAGSLDDLISIVKVKCPKLKDLYLPESF